MRKTSTFSRRVAKLLSIFFVGVLVTSCQPNSSTTERSSIKTNNADFTIAAVGDISCNQQQRLRYPCKDREVAELIESKNPDYVLLLGDIQYQSATTNELQNNFAKNWADLLDRDIPIPGNHEYRTAGAKDYFAFFNDFPIRGYYTKKLNDTWSILAINTNDKCEVVRCDKGSTQYKWIEDKLQQDRCFIAISHHPRFSTGEHGSNLFVRDVYRLLRKNNVSVLLSGHDHHYERFSTKTAQYVIGTGGKDLRPATGADNSFKIDDQFGALILTTSQIKLQTSFTATDGAVYDRSTVQCVR
jgi:3',5'-cyclic AMP phosphodiesterase CpdA